MLSENKKYSTPLVQKMILKLGAIVFSQTEKKVSKIFLKLCKNYPIMRALISIFLESNLALYT